MAEVAVAVMAKVPVPGAVKTRLCPPLSPEEAATLARCFLLDRVEQLQALDGAVPIVAYAPPEGGPALGGVLPAGVRLVPQEGPDLGARLARLLARLLAEGAAGAVALDADSPSLPSAFVAEACAALRTGAADVVVGPAEDGGYYLIGLRAPTPALFTDIAWSTPSVLPETVARIHRLGLRLRLLPPWFDVDRAEDLDRLQAEGRRPGPAHRPARTLAYLETLARTPGRPDGAAFR